MARCLSAPVGVPLTSVGSRTFSTAVRHSSKVGRWNIMPTSDDGPFTSLPSTPRLPEVLPISPAISRSKVDFPQPLGPTSETKVPRLMSKLALSSATTSRLKILATPLAEMTASSVSGAGAVRAGMMLAARAFMRFGSSSPNAQPDPFTRAGVLDDVGVSFADAGLLPTGGPVFGSSLKLMSRGRLVRVGAFYEPAAVRRRSTGFPANAGSGSAICRRDAAPRAPRHCRCAPAAHR